MEITTERLILRNFNENDMEDLYLLLKDNDTNKYLPWYPLKSIDETIEFYNNRILQKYIDNIGYFYAICLKDNKPIGYIAISNRNGNNFGYALRKEFWNKGIATEASLKMIEILKDNNFKFITAVHDVNNIPSGEVMKKIGMVYKYSYKEKWQLKNKIITFRMYQLNFDNSDFIYKGFLDKYPEHFIEDSL